MRVLLYIVTVSLLLPTLSRAQEFAAFPPEWPNAFSFAEPPSAFQPERPLLISSPEAPSAFQPESPVSFVDAPSASMQKHEEGRFHLFRIFPVNTVADSQSAGPLSARDKWRLFVKDKTDPCTLGWVAFNAGLMQASDDFPAYGHGAGGYAKRFGASLADETAAGFFGTFLFPSLLHQDPRYHRMGTGPFQKRLGHALIRSVLTYKDSGGLAFNWSGILASLATSSLSNAYYPEKNRGVGPTFSRVGTGIPFSMIDQVVNEFGPDLQKKVFRRKR
jgi:hypothetical protein